MLVDGVNSARTGHRDLVTATETASATQPLTEAALASLDACWSRYVPEAVMRTGLQAQLAVLLFTNERVLGGLNLCSTTSTSIDPGAIQSAELFATHAALALARARRESDLNDAIATRQEIGMAIGLTIDLDSERAFQYLVRASSTSQIKIRDIAQQIVRTANAQHQPETRD